MSSEDGDIVHNLTGKFRKGGPRRAVVSAAASDGEDISDVEILCALCGAPCRSDYCRLSKFQLKPLDKDCYNALHSLQRLMDKHGGELKSSAEHNTHRRNQRQDP
jgi:hypothetical protein